MSFHIGKMDLLIRKTILHSRNLMFQFRLFSFRARKNGFHLFGGILFGFRLMLLIRENLLVYGKTPNTEKQ
jgi:hypothetical protein